MEKILKVVCICFGVLNYQGKNSMTSSAVSRNISSSVSESGKIQSIMNNDINNTYNYPNPFRSSTTIIYNVINPGIVTIKIFDLLGSEICLYDDGFRDIGECKKLINLSFLNSGVYFYELKVDGRRLAINKLILVK